VQNLLGFPNVVWDSITLLSVFPLQKAVDIIKMSEETIPLGVEAKLQRMITQGGEEMMREDNVGLENSTNLELIRGKF